MNSLKCFGSSFIRLAAPVLLLAALAALSPPIAPAQQTTAEREDSCHTLFLRIDAQTKKIDLLEELADLLDDARTADDRENIINAFIKYADLDRTAELKERADDAEDAFRSAANGAVPPEYQLLDYRKMLATELKMDWDPVWDTNVLVFLASVSNRRQYALSVWKTEIVPFLKNQTWNVRDIRLGPIPYMTEFLDKDIAKREKLKCEEFRSRFDAGRPPTRDKPLPTGMSGTFTTPWSSGTCTLTISAASVTLACNGKDMDYGRKANSYNGTGSKCSAMGDTVTCRVWDFKYHDVAKDVSGTGLVNVRLTGDTATLWSTVDGEAKQDWHAPYTRDFTPWAARGITLDFKR